MKLKKPKLGMNLLKCGTISDTSERAQLAKLVWIATEFWVDNTAQLKLPQTATTPPYYHLT